MTTNTNFWASKSIMQPTVSAHDTYWTVNPIVADCQAAPVEQQPKPMFLPYEWATYDSSNVQDMQFICDFLNRYYKLFKSNSKFKFFYTPDYLQWSLGTNNIIIGMRTKVVAPDGAATGAATGGLATGGLAIGAADTPTYKLGGIICGSIRSVQLFEKELTMGNANYLCVHPKLHNKNIASLLMDELIRVFATKNIIYGSFASPKLTGRPVCHVEYFHRPLNYKKLQENGFVNLDIDVPIIDTHNLFKIYYKPKNKIIKLTKLNSEYYETVYNLLLKYQEKYNYYEKYTSLASFTNTFINDNISSYIIVADNGDILDFFSYYKLPYKTPNDTFINAGYMHTYTTNNSTSLTIFKSALLSDEQENLDIFTAPDTMENMDILYDNFSKFSKSDNKLYLNLYNLTCPVLKSEQVALVSL